jgi:uncharacterized protein (DUF4415 family)
MNAERIVRRSLGSGRTREIDWSRFDQMTDADVETAVRSDPDAAPLVDDDWFKTAQIIEPAIKEAISIRVDKDVLDFFRATSKRYQTKINAVLRAYMEHELSKR